MDKLLNLRKNVVGLICLAITVGIFLAGLWPLNFRPENKVKWLQDQNSVNFFGQALIYSTISFFQSSNIPVKSFSLELYLQSTTEEIPNIGHIFSILDEQDSEIFFVGQWKSHLLIGKGIHGKKTYREMGIRDVLKKGNKRLVTITSGPYGTNIYVDGILVKSSPKFQLFSMNEKPSGRILLGNSPNGKGYWTGNLLSLSIYDRVLKGEEAYRNSRSEESKGQGLIARYLFDEHSGTVVHDSVDNFDLAIPLRFQALKKTVLAPPWEDFQLNRSYLMDVLINILGFIPFGLFFSAYLRMRKPRSNLRLLLISVIIAGCVSLSIELIQVYLPTRNSQLTDVITNILGAAIGVVLFFKMQAAVH